MRYVFGAQPVPALFLAGVMACLAPAACGQPSRTFEKIQLSSTFYAEGAAIGDIDGDGRPDVVAGPYWYEGPRFERKHAFYEPQMYDPRNYSDNFIAAVDDVDGDGARDILVVGFPGREAWWFENPQREEGYWQRHLVHPAVDNESPAFYDLTADGSLELVFHTGGYLGYAAPGPDDPREPWTFTRISQQREWGVFTHGFGLGDLDGDGQSDVIKREGWWENPGPEAMDRPWRYHPADFGPGGAQMYAYDVDFDRRSDVITTLDAHGWGLAWFRRLPGSGGGERFERRLIMGEAPGDSPYGVRFSQPHALAMADLDRDGAPDLVTGKRFWAHGPLGGFEPNAPAVLYWFRLVRTDDGAAHFIPYLVDDDSGAGVQIATGDLNGDDYPDIVTCNKNGTFVFLNRPAR